MESPTSSILRTKGTKGFTLVEILISASISSVLVAAVLSSFLMIGRTGANIQNYTELEAQARKSLEIFSREAREAYGVANGYSSTSVTLYIPDTTATRNNLLYSVTYTFDTVNGNFTRTGPPVDNPTATGPFSPVTMVSNVQQITGVNPFNYYRYVTTAGYSNGFTSNTASNTTEIKQIEINFVLRRTSTTVVSATNRVLSARFILRNK